MTPLEYMRERLQAAKFRPYTWLGEDMNLGAFNSHERFIQWYTQGPGVENQPYRDRGFYCRELALLSQEIQPRKVVELGTSLGIGTCLLRWLNPDAELVTVDCNDHAFLPGDVKVEIGHLAKYQGFECEYVRSNSWNYSTFNIGSVGLHYVDLCFIDADHSYSAVALDSEQAWYNRSRDHRWAIIWHDHNDRHPGVMTAVREFCASHRLLLQQEPDSDTVWVTGGQ